LGSFGPFKEWKLWKPHKNLPKPAWNADLKWISPANPIQKQPKRQTGDLKGILPAKTKKKT
jgi:hypothetical protein